MRFGSSFNGLADDSAEGQASGKKTYMDWLRGKMIIPGEKLLGCFGRLGGKMCRRNLRAPAEWENR
jgi:hypothetical protein